MLFRKRPGVASVSLVLVLAFAGCKSKQAKPADEGQPVQVDKDKEVAADSRKAQDFFDEGALAENASEYVKARDLYLKAKTTYPDAGTDAAGFKTKVDAKLAGLEEIVVAQQDLQNGSAAPDAKKAELEVRYADALRKRGALDKASAQLDEALKLNPQSGAAQSAMARVTLEENNDGSLKGALDRYNKALDSDKGSAEACYELAWLNRTAQVDGADPAKTLDLAKKAVELGPNDYKCHELLASCLKDAGQQDQAVAELVTACKTSNGLPRLMKKLEAWAPGTKVELPPPPAPAADKPADKPAEMTGPPAADKPADTPPAADKPAETPPAAGDKPADKPAETPPPAAGDKPADKPAETPPPAAGDKPADKPAETPPAEKKEGGM